MAIVLGFVIGFVQEQSKGDKASAPSTKALSEQYKNWVVVERHLFFAYGYNNPVPFLVYLNPETGEFATARVTLKKYMLTPVATLTAELIR